MYAKVNEYGFLKLCNKIRKTLIVEQLTDEVVYLAAYDEELVHITDQSVRIDDNGCVSDLDFL